MLAFRFLFLTAACCWAVLASSQTPPLAHPEGDLAVQWQHFNVESGLSSQQVTDVTLDDHGFLWCSTAKGLNRFDGVRFEPFGPTLNLRTLALDPSGALWLGASGLRDWVRWDSIPRFDPHALETQAALHVSGWRNVHFMRSSQGVWIAGEGGQIGRLEGAELRVLYAGGDSIGWIEPLHTDPRKGSWFIWHHRDPALGAGLIHAFSGEFRTTASSSALQVALRRGVLRWGSDGSVLCFHPDGGLHSTKGGDTVLGFRELHPKFGFLSENPYTGHAWVVNGNQLLIFNAANELIWQDQIAEDPEWGRHITKIRFSSKDDGWICSNRGITHVEVHQTGFYALPDPLLPKPNSRARLNSMRTLMEWSPDTLIFCNDLGQTHLLRRTPSGWTTSPLLVPNTSSLSMAARLPGDSLIVVCDGLWYEGRMTGDLRPVAENNVIDSWSLEALDGTLENWLIGHHGLTRYNRSSARAEAITASPEERDELGDVYCMQRIGPGELLLGSSTGFWRYVDGSRSLERYPGVDDAVYSMHAMHGQCWLGTATNGLVAYDLDSRTFTAFNRRTGLSDDRIYAVLEDGCGNLWLSSDRGLMRFHINTGAVDVFARTEGLHQLEFNRTSFESGASGRLYFGGLEGMTVVDPAFWPCRSFEANANIGLLALDALGVKSGGKRNVYRDWAAGSIVQLTPSFPILTAEFRLLEWGPGGHTYATRILGADENWHETESNSVRIAGLAPGDYTLEVRARFRGGQWSKNGLLIPIRMEPAWTQTRAFRMGVAAAVLVLGWGLFLQAKRRTQQLERLVAERTASLEEAVQLKDLYLREVHHRVKNNMQIVGNLLDLQTTHVQHDEAKRTLREGRSRIASIALVHQELHQAGETKSLSLQRFAARLFDLNCKLYGWDAADARLHLSGEDVEMNLDTSIPMGLILNELITNSFKHSQPNSSTVDVDLHVRRAGEGRYMALYDDHGKGLPPDIAFSDERSLGLWLVAEMVHQLGGVVRVSRRTRSRLIWTFEDTA